MPHPIRTLWTVYPDLGLVELGEVLGTRYAPIWSLLTLASRRDHSRSGSDETQKNDAWQDSKERKHDFSASDDLTL